VLIQRPVTLAESGTITGSLRRPLTSPVRTSGSRRLIVRGKNHDQGPWGSHLDVHVLSGSRTPGFRRWTLSADRFEVHLDYLKNNGHRSVAVAELASWGTHG
jgi:hypothetical protein